MGAEKHKEENEAKFVSMVSDQCNAKHFLSLYSQGATPGIKVILGSPLSYLHPGRVRVLSSPLSYLHPGRVRLGQGINKNMRHLGQKWAVIC